MLPAPHTATLPHGRLTWRESGPRGAPALVLLHGIGSPPEANAKRLAAAGPGARLEMLTGIGHLPHLEAPARFNAAVMAFVRQHSRE